MECETLSALQNSIKQIETCKLGTQDIQEVRWEDEGIRDYEGYIVYNNV